MWLISGRQAPRKAENTNRNNTPTQNSGANGRWWEDIGDASQVSDRDRRRMAAAAHAMGDNYHSLGDRLYQPGEPTARRGDQAPTRKATAAMAAAAKTPIPGAARQTRSNITKARGNNSTSKTTGGRGR